MSDNLTVADKYYFTRTNREKLKNHAFGCRVFGDDINAKDSI